MREEERGCEEGGVRGGGGLIEYNRRRLSW